MFSPDRRKAFTLLEISIVLGLMVIIAALAIPIFRSALKGERLRKAAQSINADWTRTRTLAMRTGDTQVWSCLLSDGTYSTSVYDNGGTTIGQMASASAASTGIAVQTNENASGAFGESMPEGVSITEVLVSEADAVTTMSQTTVAANGAAATVFFYPDGSSSSARLTVANEEGRSISLVMNGMAGTIRVMPMKAALQ